MQTDASTILSAKAIAFAKTENAFLHSLLTSLQQRLPSLQNRRNITPVYLAFSTNRKRRRQTPLTFVAQYPKSWGRIPIQVLTEKSSM
jgi:hypothetical protein